MKRWVTLAGGVLIAGAVSWWVLQVALLEPGERSTASGYGQFVLAALGFLIIVGNWVGKAFIRGSAQSLDGRANLLAATMRDQWEKAARERRLLEPAPLPIRWRRSMLPVAVPVEAATSGRAGQARFDPLPGLTQTTSARLREGNRSSLHSVYGGLASGRLVIAGPAGSGKSAAAILLLLDALRYRERDPAHIPVPVMFTLHGWDPATVSVRDWLATKLTEIPLLRRGGATELLDAGRIAVFLDGLDEIHEDLRPVALRALSDQATFRLVLLTRSAELVDAAQHGPLVGAAAIEIQPITPADAREYLLRPLVSPAPRGWQAVADNLSSGPLAKALDNPLTLTLLLDAYPPPGPVNELLDTTRFPTSDDIENHLLDHALIAAYTRRPGQPPPRYSLGVAQRTFGYIAHRLNQDGHRDLAWWTIPQLASIKITPVASGLATMPAFIFGITLWNTRGPEYGLIGGMLALILLTINLKTRVERLYQPSIDEVSSHSPIESWRDNLAAGFLSGCAGGFVFGLAFWPTFVLRAGSQPGIAIGLAVGLVLVAMLGCFCAFTAVWPACVAQVQLALRYRTPVRLLRFLEDARSRRVLRTVGPVYQFRHAKLQDRLAAKVSKPA